jgi:hypothetical protein
MATPLSVSMQTAKIEVLEWIANEQDEDLVWAAIYYIKTLKNKSKDYPSGYPFAPENVDDLYNKIIAAQNSNKWHSTNEVREKAKNWGK